MTSNMSIPLGKLDNASIQLSEALHFGDSLKTLYEATRADFIFIATVDKASNVASTLYVLEDGLVADNFQYDLSHSPCADVFSFGACIFPNAVQEIFPNDETLTNFRVEGYLGEPLVTANGETVGLLVALYKQEIDDPQLSGILFSTFASRITAEMLNMLRAVEVEKLNTELLQRNELLKEIGFISKTGGWEYNLSSESIFWTDETFHILGLDPKTALPNKVDLLSTKSTLGHAFNQAIKFVLANKQPYCKESLVVLKNGQQKWVLTTGALKKDDDGNISQIYGAFEDITEYKELIDKEKDKANFLEGVLNSLQDAVVTVNRSGLILSANNAMVKIFGYQVEELVGKNVSMLMTDAVARVHDRYIEQFSKDAETRILGLDRELLAKRKNGEQFYMELSLSNIVQRDDDIMIGIIRDLTERKLAERNLHLLAYYDSVTELPNLKSFESDVRNLMGRASIIQAEILTFIIDINRFSQINLAYGSKVGDDVLRIIACRLKQCVNEQFKLYRGQNDTYIIKYLLPITYADNFSDHEIQDIQQNIKAAISRDMVIRGTTQRLTGSIGVVRVSSDKTNYEKLIMLLEYAVKEIKRRGEDSLLSLDEDSLRNFERKKLIQSSIGAGLRNNEFYINLQPQFDEQNNIVTSELLLRWMHPTLGFVPPDEFITIAEQTDDIIHLSRWVLNQACALIQSNLKNGLETRIAVNISGKHIVRPDFVSSILKTLKDYSVPPNLLVLELTETILVSDINYVRPKIEELSAIGIRFSIDDFGTGYSSLKYLRALPIHELKIDRFFVEEIQNENANTPIVNTIIEMAKALGLHTVAEGVETQSQLSYLKAKGCTIYQGYYLAKPLPVDVWQAKIESQSQQLAEQA